MKKKKITIIDFGVGNLLSLKRAFENVGAEVMITNKQEKIINSSYIVLPGVGAFQNAMKSIINLKLVDCIKNVADKKLPLLGICLGAQLLLQKSEEFGTTDGLGIIKGAVKPINLFNIKKKKIIIPHIGWANIVSTNDVENKDNLLFKDLNKDDFFYFVHSYVSKPLTKEQILYKTNYEDIDITAIHGTDNVYGFQFHPEKSGLSGLKLLKNFLLL
tara:strand:- start:206 stop:853 length:648 start_codon:yes stop_codon:yes gene_type:complete